MTVGKRETDQEIGAETECGVHLTNYFKSEKGSVKKKRGDDIIFLLPIFITYIFIPSLY